MELLKSQKEHFVTGLKGGKIDEIALHLLLNVFAYFLWGCLARTGLTLLYLDFAVNCLLILSSITVYAGRIKLLLWLAGLPILLTLFSRDARPAERLRQHELLPRKQFITSYRLHMLILTNLAILAVDFRVFPRRFAKVETWGTSLMDLGVGAFVFSMGLVSSRSLIKSKGSKNAYFKHLKRATGKSVPLLVLGLGRLVLVKFLNYQEHVTEYGVHWNFFITLGLIPVILAVIDPILQVLPRALVAFTITGCYEYILHSTNLLNFILDPGNRMELIIAMNKEGIWSFWGYISIFLFGQSFGQFVMTGYPTRNNLVYASNVPSSGLLLVSATQGLAISSIFYGAILFYVENLLHFSQISRQLANFPYVIWIVSFSSFVLLGYSLLSELGLRYTSRIIEATNNNGLLAFLLGNVCTGLVNMSINTLECTDMQAFLVLVAYISGLSAILLFLDHQKIYIKF